MATRHAERFVETDFAGALLDGHKEGVDDANGGCCECDGAKDSKHACHDVEEGLNRADDIVEGHAGKTDFFKCIVNFFFSVVVVVVSCSDGVDFFFFFGRIILGVFFVNFVGQVVINIVEAHCNNARSDYADNFGFKFDGLMSKAVYDAEFDGFVDCLFITTKAKYRNEALSNHDLIFVVIFVVWCLANG